MHSTNTTTHFPVVGIGASFGSTDPLIKIFNLISPSSEMAYILMINQLSEYDISSLIEKFQASTAIRIEEIISDITLLPNRIYIVPKGYGVINFNGSLKLEKINHIARQYDCIDLFFKSLAEVHQSYAMGMLLSGKGFDGVEGLKNIREYGGVTIVQDPESADFKGMPQNAIEADIVDFIWLPEEIPLKIVRVHESYKTNCAYSDAPQMHESTEVVLDKILDLVSIRSGNIFKDYKRPVLRRRIARRMVILMKETMLEYYNVLRIDKAEQDVLFNDLMITVTYFFRDKSLFESLTKEVFPKLVQNAVNNSIRIWVAGCSTGEEAYSIAISLNEYLSAKNITGIKVQIFASDICADKIASARIAIYSAQDVQSVSDKRLGRYFKKRDGYYHITKTIRDMCVFAVHNFANSSPFAKMNLISCQNVFKYLNDGLQSKILKTFHYSLQENGLLLLGTSEVANEPHLFKPFRKNDTVYIRQQSSERYVPEAFESAHGDSRVKMKEFIKRVSSEQQAAFEQLYVFNQELEKSTEELKSNNEELLCINDELVDRQDQLISLRNYSELIINTLRQPLIVVDHNFTIKTANPAFHKYFGITEKQTEGCCFFEIANCDGDVVEFKKQLHQVLINNTGTDDFKMQTFCPGIGKKIMMVNARKIIDSKPAGMILIALEDITDVVAMNELLVQRNEELKIHNEQLESFSSSASHDLQEPLRKIHMHCTRIIDEEKNLSETGKYSLDRVVTSIENMTQLITDLIGFTQANIIFKKDFKKTDLNLTLKKTMAYHKDIIAEKDAQLLVSPLPSLHVFPHQIQQLFSNLIVNSIKYTADGVIPQIRIETEHPPQEEVDRMGGDTTLNYIKIKVSDNGIGFPSKYAHRVFDPFFRLHSKDEYRGSGLGLTLSKKIVVNHNGIIHADSQENQGTVISVYLPMS